MPLAEKSRLAQRAAAAACGVLMAALVSATNVSSRPGNRKRNCSGNGGRSMKSNDPQLRLLGHPSLTHLVQLS